MSTLVKYNEACRAIAAARNYDEVKDIRDKADAMRHYAHQAKNRALEVDAAEIRIRAERRLGEILSAAKDAGVFSKGGRPRRAVNGISRARLRDAGIDKKLSAMTQRLAMTPLPQFEKQVAAWRDRCLTTRNKITTGLPSGLAAMPTAQRQRAACAFIVGKSDVRAWRIAELRRYARILSAIADHCGAAGGLDRVGDCISDAQISSIAAVRR
jgi:hypothetical protein